MKRVIIGLMLVSLCFINVKAIEPIKWGAVAGINLNELSNTSGSCDQFGFHVGAKAQLSLTPKFFLDGELLFIQKGYKGEMGLLMEDEMYYLDISQKNYYLELPIYVGYKIPVGDNFSFFVAGGGYLGLGLFGKYKSHTNYDGGRYSESLYKSGQGDRRFDYGFGLKGGVEIMKKIQISGGHEWGLENTKKIGSLASKNRNAMFSCAYLF